MSIRNQLTWLFAAVIVLPLVLALLYLYASGLEGDRRLLESNAVEQVGASVERELQMMSTTADMLATNPTIRQYLSIPADEQIVDEQFDEMQTLRGIVSIMDQSRPIFAVRIFMQQDKIYTADRINLLGMEAFRENPLFEGATVHATFTPVYTYRYLGQETQRILSCIRLIPHARYVTRSVGAVAVDMQADYLLQLMRAWGGERLARIALLDAAGDVILASDATEEDGRGYTLSREIAGTPWRIEATFHTGILRIFATGNTVALSASVYIVAAALLMLLIAVLVVRRISSRVGHMVDILTGAAEAAPAGGVFTSLDHALEEARDMIVRQQRQEREAVEMELRLLQAQINPHFLYNTLDSIGWMMKAGRGEAASEAIIALARYLRIALSKGADVICVEEEIDMARLYGDIQQRRMEDAFTIEYDVEPEAAGCLLPKMTLQPIIENAILHGQARHISVYAYTEADALVLSITDNGIGIEEEALAALLLRRDGPGRGFGLYNVDQRVCLFSGGQAGYGLTVESETGKYTTFTLRVVRKEADQAKQ